MLPIKQWKRLAGLSLLCGMMHVLTAAAPGIVMTLDRDYYNPFAAAVKYDLRFDGFHEGSILDVTCTIVDNRTGRKVASDTFRGNVFGIPGAFYFFIRNNSDSYESLVCLTAPRGNFKSGATVMSRQLKDHWMLLPEETLLAPSEKKLLFTIKPCPRERTAATRAGFENLFFGSRSGTSEIDCSLFIEFRKAETKGKALPEKQPEKEPPAPRTEKELEKALKEAEEKYKLGQISIDELNQLQKQRNQFFRQNRRNGTR